MSSKRQREPSPSQSQPSKKVANTMRLSNLRPVFERKLAVAGEKDEAMLRIEVENIITKDRKELMFTKMLTRLIDWNNKDHIRQINSWRNQIYNRAGMKNKEVHPWHIDEQDWMELYCQVLIKEANEQDVAMIPQVREVYHTFSRFFEEKVLQSATDGTTTYQSRGQHAFSSKWGRKTQHLKNYFFEITRGKSGDYFHVNITSDMLLKYQELKKDLEDLGSESSLVIPWNKIYDEKVNDVDAVRCREFLESLPEHKDMAERRETSMPSEMSKNEMSAMANTNPDDTKLEGKSQTAHSDADSDSELSEPPTSPSFLSVALLPSSKLVPHGLEPGESSKSFTSALQNTTQTDGFRHHRRGSTSSTISSGSDNDSEKHSDTMLRPIH